MINCGMEMGEVGHHAWLSQGYLGMLWSSVGPVGLGIDIYLQLYTKVSDSL